MKKFLSIMLSILMVVTMLPMAVLPASAAENLDYNITVEVVDWAVYDTSGELIGEFNAVEHGDAFYDVSLTQADDGTFTFSYQIALERNGGNTAWDESSISFRIDSCEDEFMQEFEKSCYSNYNIFYNLKVTRRAGHSFSDWTDAGDGTHTRTCVINSAHKETASHNYAAATCSAPETCKNCGATQGEPVADAHGWNAATCVLPQTCKYCGITQGEELGHDIVAATFGKPAACSRCGATDINISVLEAALINTNVNLPSKAVKDDNSGYNDITWSVVDAGSTGATINGNTLKALYPGEAIIRATIESGSKDFTVRFIKSENIDISLGSVVVSQKDDSTLTVTYAGFEGGSKDYIVGEPIQITGTTTSNYVEVSSGAATIILNDVSISRNGYCFRVNGGATADLTLVGSNAMSTGSTYAALSVPENATVIIGGEGTLTATSSKESAAIGSGYSDNGTGTIVINGGTIIAENTYSSGSAGAGIGGGNRKNGGNITINGGIVTANGGRYAAGIGGGNYENGGNITINGGIVTATGGESAAGIGGGLDGDGGQITITGGTVIAKGGDYRQFYSGAGIGGGYDGNGGTVVITGGNIKVIAGSSKAEAIGKGGNGESSGTLKNASGNDVTLRTVTLSGAVADTPVTRVEGITYGLTDVKTYNTDKLYFYLPADAVITSITAGGNEYICNSNLTYYTSHDWSNLDGICANGCGLECHHENETGDICSVCGVHCGECTYTDNGDGTHSFTCTICHITGTENHTGGTATCKEQAKCEHCGVSYGEVNAHDWSNLDGVCANGCGEVCPHEKYTNGVCDKCGYACPHDSYTNGFCTECDAYEPAELKDGYYQIKNGGNLFWYANYINTVDRTANAVLTADIDLENRPWTPIGSTGENSNNFRGIFDGQNHTITGLNVEGGRAGLGFFGEVRLGTVENFTIYGEVKLNGKYSYVGGVIGSAPGASSSDGSVRNGATIRNITSYVNVTLGEDSNGVGAHGSGYVGGFIGYTNHETLIENCTWYGILDLGIYRAQSGVGGLVGAAYNNSSVTIRDCAAYGTIKTAYKSGTYNNQATIYIGGIVSNSVASASTTIENTIWAGTIVNDTDLGANAHISAFGTLSGIKGVVNCYALENSAPYITTNNANSDGITEITAEQLTSGETAYKLGDAWGQKIGTDEKPVLGGEKVYYGYTSCGDTEAGYTNNAAATQEKPDHTQKPAYTDNHDGTHSAVYPCCGTTFTEPHSTTAEDDKEATCVAKAYCSVCDSEYGEVDITNHDETVEYTNGFCTECDAYEPAVLNGDVYEISNAGQLYWFSEKVNAGETTINGKLMGNIVVNDGTMTESSTDARAWTPIGNDSNQYTGNFNGNGNTISGLYFNDSSVDDVGLFGYVGAEGKVQNVGVINSYISGKNYVGGVVGVVNDYCTVTNCYNTGTVSGNKHVGGVIGSTYEAVMTDCYNTGAVSGTEYVGGVVGYLRNATVTGCYNTGAVIGGNEYVGGVAGYSRGTVNNCYNTGAVIGIYHIGGVVGHNDAARGGNVRQCYNIGTVTGRIGGHVGGVVGEGYALKCYYLDTCGATGEGTAKTAEQFKSGEVAYLLNGSKSEGDLVWGQLIGTDSYPVFGGETVYYNESKGYYNLHTCDFSGEWKYDADKHWKECTVYGCSEISEEAGHTYTNGKCDCGYECPHENVTGATCITSALCDVCGLEVYDLTNHEGEYVTVWFNDYQHVSEYECCHIGSSVVYEDHKYENYTVITPADCVNNAWEMGECICGDIHIREIVGSAKNHDWSDKNGICTNCGEECPHEWDEGVLTRPVYDAVLGSKDGYYTYTCIVCAKEKKETVKSADYSAYDEVSEEINGLLQSDELTNAAKQAIYSAANECGRLSNDLTESEQNIVDDLVAELEKIVADAEEKIASGEYVKIDGMKEYNKIADALDAELMENYSQEEIAALAEKAGDEINARFGEIIEKAEALTGTVAENKDALAEIESELRALYGEIKNCLDGVHNGLVYEVTEEAKCEVNAIESATCTLCGETDEREIEGTALSHSFTKYEVTEKAECGKAGKEVAYCDHGCQTTDEKEIPALKHSFTKYEVTEEAECGKAGKEVACCDHGCGATDENEIPALKHSFVNYIYNNDATCEADGTKTAKCANGCGATNKIKAEGTKLDHVDGDGDYICDYGCGHIFEQPDTPDDPADDTCHMCGGKVHGNDIMSRISCFFAMIIRFVTEVLTSVKK